MSFLRVAVFHAYSSHNAGDGWLVDETVQLVAESLGVDDPIVVALDAASFADRPWAHRVRQYPGGTGSQRFAVAGPLSAVFSRSARGFGRRLAAEIRDADIAVGVGGGYLRTGTPGEAARVALAHIPQLAVGGRSPRSVLLPQSIGPLRGPIGRAIAARLADFDLVCLRDDRSLEELLAAGVDGARLRRFPDLVALALGRDTERAVPQWTEPAEGRVAVVARAVGRGGDPYRSRLLEVARVLGAEWLVQSRAGSGNQDEDFYRSLGLSGPFRPVGEAVDEPGGVLVSVRLHACLAALRKGWYVVHLATERKGFGVFADLGLDPFVLNGLRCSPEDVVKKVAEVQEGWRDYADAYHKALIGLADQRRALVEEMAAVGGVR